jgi:hypothetical protein
MPMTIEGFGRPIDSSNLKRGDLAFRVEGTREGPRSTLALRVGHGGDNSYEVVLAIYSGPTLGRPVPHVTDAGAREYVSIEGEVVLQPSGPPVPMADDLPPGTLVIDGTGAAFIRIVEGGGVEYCKLTSGEFDKPGSPRAYFTSWQLVLRQRSREAILVSMVAGKGPIARSGPPSLEITNPGVV